MTSVLDKKRDFIFKHRNKEVVVIRKGAPYEMHGHFRNMAGAQKCVHLLCKGILPTNDYFAGSAKRLLYREEFKGLK